MTSFATKFNLQRPPAVLNFRSLLFRLVLSRNSLLSLPCSVCYEINKHVRATVHKRTNFMHLFYVLLIRKAVRKVSHLSDSYIYLLVHSSLRSYNVSRCKIKNFVESDFRVSYIIIAIMILSDITKKKIIAVKILQITLFIILPEGIWFLCL